MTAMNLDQRGRWFLAGALAGPASQVLALIASRTVLAFGDEQFELVGAIAAGSALLAGSVALVGGSIAPGTRSRGKHLQLLAFLVLAAFLPAILWRSGGVVILGLAVLLALCAVIALVRVLADAPASSAVHESASATASDPARESIVLPATLWAVWGSLVALLVAVEVSVVLQAIANPVRWVAEVSADFEGQDGLVFGRQLTVIAGVISAPLGLALLAWVIYWAAAAFSRPRAQWSVPIAPFPAKGPVRLGLMIAWAVGLLGLQVLTVLAWQSAGGGTLPQPVVWFFVLQQLFVAPILGVVVAVAVRGDRKQRPLGLGIVVGIATAVVVLGASLLLR